MSSSIFSEGVSDDKTLHLMMFLHCCVQTECMRNIPLAVPDRFLLLWSQSNEKGPCFSFSAHPMSIFFSLHVIVCLYGPMCNTGGNIKAHFVMMTFYDASVFTPIKSEHNINNSILE